MFKLTEKAKEKIKEMINKEGQDYYLRVYDIPSGCCGIDFGMDENGSRCGSRCGSRMWM